MARIGGKKGYRGVCGIARSPSVALGGMFTKDVDVYARTYQGGGRGSLSSSKTNMAYSQMDSLIHRIRSNLGFVQKGIMMSTINGR